MLCSVEGGLQNGMDTLTISCWHSEGRRQKGVPRGVAIGSSTLGGLLKPSYLALRSVESESTVQGPAHSLTKPTLMECLLGAGSCAERDGDLKMKLAVLFSSRSIGPAGKRTGHRSPGVSLHQLGDLTSLGLAPFV